MKGEFEFIDRVDEIAAIGNVIAEWGKRRIVCLSGERGIGKTFLLDHLIQLYPKELQERSKLLVSRRIDFYDPELHVKDTLTSTIMNQLGEAHFAEYVDALVMKRRMEIDQYPPSRVKEEDEKADRAFIQCFNRISINHRLILFIDTVEHIYGSETWYFLIRLASQISNTVIIFGGRNTHEIRDALASSMSEDEVKFIQLYPFNLPHAQSYLQQKQIELHVALDTQLAEKVLALAAGKPLLIDLAIDWLTRGIPIPLLLEKTSDELQNLSEEQRRELEKALVSPIAELRETRDHLLWIMALIRPLSREIAERLTNWTAIEFERVWQDVSRLSFVKILPGDQLMIHDVIRDMLLNQLQDEIEPERKSVWLSDTLTYLMELSDKIRKQLEDIKIEERRARNAQNDKEFWELFVKEGKTERALWTIEGQFLGYRILQNPEAGLAAFEQDFKLATNQNNLQKRAVLLAQVQEARDRLSLSPKQEYRIDVLHATQFLEMGMYDQAEELIRKMLGRFEPQAETEIRIILGNILIRRGNFQDALSHFEHAIRVSSENHFSDLLVRAQNAYGWGCRLMGRLEEAANHYRDALKLALQLQNEDQQALILNNLGYVYALQRNRESAVRLCQQALDLFKKIGNQQGIGRVYSTLGDIWTEFNGLPQALEYYEKALHIFEPIPMRDMLSTIYSSRGRALWLIGEFDSARKELERAQSIGLQKDKPFYLHYLAEVYLSQGNFSKAEELFEGSYRESLAAPDPFFELNSLGDLVKIAMLEGKLELRKDYRNRLENFTKQHAGIRYRLPQALLLRYLADMYLLADEIQEALGFYDLALPQIAEVGSYEPYTISGQLIEMEDTVLSRLNSESVEVLGKQLEQSWYDNHHEERWPEALPFFAKWKSWSAFQGEIQK